MKAAAPLVGELPGCPPGTLFEGRRALSEAGVHRPLQAGIAGTALGGAVSVVLSGGYEDDQDSGHQILYTGEGGRDPRTGAQTAHQLLTRGNLALARSHLLGQPVRVVRRVAGATYRYDGLFLVTAFWHEVGRSGYRIWRFLLESEATLESEGPTAATAAPDRHATTRLRRLSRHAAQVKAWHDHTCQLCGLRLSTPAGPYAEAAHIRPLGQPHGGEEPGPLA
ncbi:YDG/SRA domain-containing protein [Deinococcus multiflagellatus]|uniref:YDG/SRA domain-containing protein n=1 Tax=Deinococcus multiflagellatus TaxID=1656887 RepID=A0ABW1ZJ91_9DEIO|nr:YDG/SRA domain-containing protein [Deinococcus multiflagellatus]MBZ9712341.1 YDG/SRA domain-containing protein [Deinococcus multiflagellatus]